MIIKTIKIRSLIGLRELRELTEQKEILKEMTDILKETNKTKENRINKKISKNQTLLQEITMKLHLFKQKKMWNCKPVVTVDANSNLRFYNATLKSARRYLRRRGKHLT